MNPNAVKQETETCDLYQQVQRMQMKEHYFPESRLRQAVLLHPSGQNSPENGTRQDGRQGPGPVVKPKEVESPDSTKDGYDNVLGMSAADEDSLKAGHFSLASSSAKAPALANFSPAHPRGVAAVFASLTGRNAHDFHRAPGMASDELRHTAE